MNKSSIKFD